MSEVSRDGEPFPASDAARGPVPESSPAEWLSDAERQALLFARDLSRLNALRRSYERLVPAALDPGAPPAEEPRLCEATLLFTDVRGFTSLAERFAGDARRLLAAMNEHLAGVVHAVTRCGGSVEKFGGDGVLATFGARAAVADHRDRAVAAALGALGANERLNRRRAPEWGFRLDMGVGVATGSIVLGRIGSPERWEQGVLGDPVNIAARLVASAGATEVLLDQKTYSGLSGGIKADLLGDLAVRGRIGSVTVYRISMRARPRSVSPSAPG